MSTRESKFNKILKRFPADARNRLKSIPSKGGKLEGDDTMALLDIMNFKIEDLMLALLPIASTWAVAPISAFTVGAVARTRDSALYLGANLEICGLPLNQTIHAEQAAIMNAWHRGAKEILSIAVSAAPCGYCRQFLYELNQSRELSIITLARENQTHHRFLLSDLLPDAFGPADLNVTSGLNAFSENSVNLKLQLPTEDPVILEALKASEKSYAPYTQNYSGCSIRTSDNDIYIGRYAENAAYNPGLSPLQSAIAGMNLYQTSDQLKIDRAVLVEHPSKCIQKGITELVLASFAPGVPLEYYTAEIIE